MSDNPPHVDSVLAFSKSTGQDYTTMKRNRAIFLTTLGRTLLATALCTAIACDGDEEESTSENASEESAGEHAEHHEGGTGSEHEEHGEGDTGDEETSVTWMTEPPATATLNEDWTASWMIATSGDLHHTELRICDGAEVSDCGLGESDSYSVISAMPTDNHFMASTSFDTAGSYTVVAWCHVGPDPHVSSSVTITVE